MVHHKMPEIEERLTKSQDHLDSIRKMITQDKRAIKKLYMRFL